MRRLVRTVLVPALVAAGAGGALAHVRLTTSGGNPLHWPNPNVSIVINATGSDDVADESETAAIRLALEEWNAVEGSQARFVEDASPASQARTDFESQGIHLVLFDEDGSSGWFPPGSMVVAITPISFFTDGRIVDADVIFNGRDHGFTTSGAGGRFDVQDVATHELGHVMGLDHTGWAGASMNPFVSTAVILHRSVSEDEVHAMRDAYPAASFGRIQGTVERQADDSPVRGAHVVARDAGGRTVAGALTGLNGSFTLHGLEPGTYTVYAVPVDGATGSALADTHTIDVDFTPATFASPVTIAGTETAAVGVLAVGPDAVLSVNGGLLPVHVVADGTTSAPLFLTGEELEPGTTTLTTSDPDLVVSTVLMFSGTVSFRVTAPVGEPPGHVDVVVTNTSGETSVLPAAIEITPPAPTVDAVAPGTGTTAGGTAVTITGTGFRAGARVVIGDRVYVDGASATVVSADTIALTTDATVAGTHDVVVLDPTGIEGRLADGIVIGLQPRIDTLFPAAGDSAGGTQVVVTGADFEAGLEVRIAGVGQSVDSIEPTRVVFTTVASAATPGVAQTLEVENPDGALTAGQFTFHAQADPALAAVDPPAGEETGGETLTLTGTGFPADAEVVFGADPMDGTGGTSAASVTFVDATTLTVVTPGFAQTGAVDVLVRDASTGQASVLASAFTVQAAPGGGDDGGGGCAVRRVDGPGGRGGPRGALAGAWWMLALLVALRLRARRPAEQRLRV